jgi:hypothetical protein
MEDGLRIFLPRDLPRTSSPTSYVYPQSVSNRFLLLNKACADVELSLLVSLHASFSLTSPSLIYLFVLFSLTVTKMKVCSEMTSA